MEIDLNKVKKVHFIGIGGIGVSAVARLMHVTGKKVSGSDMSESPITEHLQKLGINISTGHKAQNINPNTDLVIYTIAITGDNPELMEAQNRDIPAITYPQMLSIISKSMNTIAISGTHGKTTTTAMMSGALIDAQKDPTVIIGSLIKKSNSNLIVGHSKLFLVEACEYRRSFLNLHPKIMVITNIDTDHLDYYKDLADIQSAFRELAMRIPKNGALICDVNNPKLKPVLNNLNCRIIDYATCDIADLKLKVPGEHNRQNAQACLAVADFMGIGKKQAKQSLENFSGTWRRFDLKGTTKSGIIIYDDYAHHPTEIQATLKGFKEAFPDKKRIAFFQPHLFSRTKILLDEFARSFSDIDEVYVLPIYAAREKPDKSITSNMLVNQIKIRGTKAFFLKSFGQAVAKTKKFSSDTAIITLGAGDIYQLPDLLLNRSQTDSLRHNNITKPKKA